MNETQELAGSKDYGQRNSNGYKFKDINNKMVMVVEGKNRKWCVFAFDFPSPFSFASHSSSYIAKQQVSQIFFCRIFITF